MYRYGVQGSLAESSTIDSGPLHLISVSTHCKSASTLSSSSVPKWEVPLASVTLPFCLLSGLNHQVGMACQCSHGAPYLQSGHFSRMYPVHMVLCCKEGLPHNRYKVRVLVLFLLSIWGKQFFVISLCPCFEVKTGSLLVSFPRSTGKDQ